jgi:hypothetical protein
MQIIPLLAQTEQRGRIFFCAAQSIWGKLSAKHLPLKASKADIYTACSKKKYYWIRCATPPPVIILPLQDLIIRLEVVKLIVLSPQYLYTPSCPKLHAQEPHT